MAKKAKKAVDSVKQVSPVTFELITDVITAHNNRVSGMIQHHIKSVADATGEVQPEDVSYVISLSNRELGHAIKQLFQSNVL